MSTENYRYETKNIDGFLSQLIRYVRQGKCFYYQRFLVPEHKEPQAICERLIDEYDIRKRRWERKSRNLGETARIHLLLHGHLFVILLGYGKHDKFRADHGFERFKIKRGRTIELPKGLPDIRRDSLKAFGYSIRFNTDRREPKVMVRLDDETRRKLKAHMMTIATWDCYRDKKRMEREFSRLHYQPYEPVYDELVSIVGAVNKVRRRRGFEKISEGCVRQFRNIDEVFVE